MFKALGHPHRLAIFLRLLRCCAPGTVCELETAIHLSVGELGDGLDIAPSTLSHHLKELQQAGLVRTRRNGKRVECWVDAELTRQLAALLEPEQTTNHGSCENHEC